jgi:hypothetical protein
MRSNVNNLTHFYHSLMDPYQSFPDPRENVIDPNPWLKLYGTTNIESQ